MRKLWLLVVLAVMAASVQAAPRIEKWNKGDTLRYVVRDEDGKFAGWGVLRCESWNDGDDTSEWVPRNANGNFVTGPMYNGRLEKWNRGPGEKEEYRLVVRDPNRGEKGRWVTWTSMTKYLDEGWQRERDGEWWYVVRDRRNGRYVNKAKPQLVTWQDGRRLLVARDTADGPNNGKFLSWIAPNRITRTDRDGVTRKYLAYQDPATKQFIRFVKE